MSRMIAESARPTLAFDDEAEARKLTVDDLSQQHRDTFTRALFNVLFTPASETTFAQIIDGAPLSESVLDIGDGVYPPTHPIHSRHPELCPGVLDQVRQSRSTFDPNDLKFDARLFYKYQAASLRSRAFKTCLIEMVATAIHQIAVDLYKVDLDLGNHKDLVTWAAPTSLKGFYKVYPTGQLPTLFMHKSYVDFEQYPNGVADIVGYWAEAQIFGGVVLFDRRKPSDRQPYEDPDAIFFHSNHKDATYRIWQLLDTQKELLEFLLSDLHPNGNCGIPCPFPIFPDQKNLTRIDPEEPMSETGIYRDIWERKPLGDDDPDPRSHCCSFNTLDYTSREDYHRSRERCWERRVAIDEKWEADALAEIEEDARAAAARQQGGEEDDDDELAKVLKKA